MARRPNRSAALGGLATSNSKSSNLLRRLLIVFCLLLISSISCTDRPISVFVGTNENNSNGFNYAGGLQTQPKFGDRISPRHRQTLSVLAASLNGGPGGGGVGGSPAGSVGGSVYTTTTTSNNHNNAHKDAVDSINHSASNNNHSDIVHVHKSPTSSSSSTVTVDDLVKQGQHLQPNSASLVDNSDLDNDYRHHHLLNGNNVSSNVVLPVTGDRRRLDHHRTSSTEPHQPQDLAEEYDRSRDDLLVQHQQLRRNDGHNDDVDDETETYQIGSAVEIANISKADRLIEMSTEFFVIPSSTMDDGIPAIVRTSTVRPILILAAKTPPTENIGGPSTVSTIDPTGTGSRSGLRKEPWVLPLLVLACIAMILMTAFEIFVLFKAWRTSPSRRHLFLGQMLLLGLFACAGIGALLTTTPTIVSCAIIRFGAGVAFALVFAALLVKCVFLISLNGGVYLPAPYQGLLLLFAVLIQVAIGTQWLMTEPADIQTITTTTTTTGSHHLHTTVTNKFSLLITSSDLSRISGTSGGGDVIAATTTIPLCKTQFSELLLSMVYIIFLIIFVAILAIKSRGIRDNYREATYIGLAIGGSIPIWLGWTLCGLIVADRHKDACLAFGLIATAATVFLVMFMPKGRQLAAMGKEGLYVEDRDDQFSSLSRAGSGYSPSFFHFKPIKYGVMGGGVMNSATSTGNCTKHQSAATLGGDRVALVAAPPPSYTRMYHYFPAHLTQPFCFYPPPPPPITPPPPPLKSLSGGGLSTLKKQLHQLHHHHQQQQQYQSQSQQQQQQQSTTTTTTQLSQSLRYPGLFLRPDETNLYTTLEPTLSSNPNVFFQRSGGLHPGMMY